MRHGKRSRRTESAIYDGIGIGYSANRRTDPRWEKQVHAALLDARTVVNVGAGAGSYEPGFAEVIAVEPSETMIRQRPRGTAPAVQAVAEKLPFSDGRFDVALAVLTTHHWSDPKAGLEELQRVSKKQVIVTWDPDWFASWFWLIRDYLPQVRENERDLATLQAVVANIGASRIEPLRVPSDCTDGFLGAFWKQPRAYLDAGVRASMSGLALLDQGEVEVAMTKLDEDLASGAWTERNSELEGLSSVDLGYRLVVCETR